MRSSEHTARSPRVAPGPIETAILNRFAEEIAETIMFSRVQHGVVRHAYVVPRRRRQDGSVISSGGTQPGGRPAGVNFLRMTKERTTMNTHQTAPTQLIEAAQRQQKGETET